MAPCHYSKVLEWLKKKAQVGDMCINFSINVFISKFILNAHFFFIQLTDQ